MAPSGENPQTPDVTSINAAAAPSLVKEIGPTVESVSTVVRATTISPARVPVVIFASGHPRSAWHGPPPFRIGIETALLTAFALCAKTGTLQPSGVPFGIVTLSVSIPSFLCPSPAARAGLPAMKIFKPFADPRP